MKNPLFVPALAVPVTLVLLCSGSAAQAQAVVRSVPAIGLPPSGVLAVSVGLLLSAILLYCLRLLRGGLTERGLSPYEE